MNLLEKTRIRGLIFDFDGLIVDTETPIYTAWSECYQAHGQSLTLEHYVGCVGSDHSAHDPAGELERLCGRPLDWDVLGSRRAERTREILDGADTRPGVRGILEEAAAHEMPCAVASSSSRAWVTGWLEKLEIRHRFRSTHTREDVDRIKPEPDLFERAAGALGLEPAEVLVLEDSLHGLRAARAAGMPCVIIPNPVTRDLAFEGALRVLESLASVSLGVLLEDAGPEKGAAARDPDRT